MIENGWYEVSGWEDSKSEYERYRKEKAPLGDENVGSLLKKGNQ